MDASNHLREQDLVERSFHRVRTTLGRATLTLGDDTGPYQVHQLEGFPTELRNDVQRLQAPGFSSMPLAGAKALVSYQAGHRGFGTILGIEDGRYRPKGLKPGETQLYGVDGADAKGGGGTTWPILQGLLGKIAKLLGLTISIGDNTTTTVLVGGSAATTVNIVVKSGSHVNVSSGGSTQAVKLADGSNSLNLFAQ